jgi:hypothetical protein
MSRTSRGITIFLIAFLCLLAAFSGVTGCQGQRSAAAKPPTKLVLKAAQTDLTPKIDGNADDKVWQKAPETVIPTEGGPDVTMKALRTDKEIFFLATWADETNDNVDSAWSFNGTEWIEGVHDDSFAVFWNINDSVSGFNQKGCQVVCHGEKSAGAIQTGPVGHGLENAGTLRMSITGPSSKTQLWPGRKQKGDIWDLSLGISNTRGSVNDYVFAIDPKYAKFWKTLTPVISRQHDAFKTPAPWKQNYVIDEQTGKKKPAFMYKDGLNMENTPYPTYDQVVPITDYSVFKEGDRLPYMLFNPGPELWGGSKADVSGRGVWKEGHWVVEIKRKLDTGHNDDIQFKVPKQGSNYYVFALALFNRIVIGHTPSQPVSLAVSAAGSISGTAAKSKKLEVRGVRRDSAPKLDGTGKDKAWSKAPETKIPTAKGSSAKMKAVYTKDHIYFLISWPDKTPQDGKLYWGFDGAKWERYNQVDDKIGLLWNIDHSVGGFDQQGCQAICHNGQMVIEHANMIDGKPWAGYKQKADAWEWAPGVMQKVHMADDGVFKAEDAFLASPETFSTARISLRFDNGDAGTKQYWTRNPENTTGGTSGEAPQFKLKSGLTFESTPFPSQNQMEQITDYSVFKAGDKIPLLMIFDFKAAYNKNRFPEGKPSGSRVDIQAYSKWQDGWWTLELSRKLDTGHNDDVQFMTNKSKLISGNVFSLALFNDSRIDHATSGPVTMILEP